MGQITCFQLVPIIRLPLYVPSSSTLLRSTFRLRSPALKPFWLGLTGSDCDQLFSALFRRFFCHASREYRRHLALCRRVYGGSGDDAAAAAAAAPGNQQLLLPLRGVVPAFLLHLTSLARTLSRGQASCLLSVREESRGRRKKLVVQVRIPVIMAQNVFFFIASIAA